MSKKHVLIFFLMLLYIEHRSQIIFNNKGEITSLEITSNVITAGNLTSAATTVTDSQVSDCNKSIKKSFKETTETLSETTYTTFLSRYIDASILSGWKTYYSASLPTHSMYTKINSFSDQNCYYSDGKKTLYQVDVYNSSLISTYNSLYQSANYATEGQVYPLEAYSLKQLSNHVIDQQDSLERYKRAIGEASFNVQTYINLYNYLENISPSGNSGNLHIEKIKKIMKSNWVKEWLWIKKGKISLNPFDFTSKEFIAQNAQYDETKAKKYNEYINALIEREISSGRIQNHAEFKTILKEKDSGADIFSFKARNDTLISKNTRLLKTASECTVALNVINPQFLTTAAFIVSPSNTVAIKGNNEYLLTAPSLAAKDSAKQVSVINFRSDSKLFINRKVTAIADRSSFQVTFDTLAGQLGAIASTITNFTPFGVLLETLYKPLNSNISVLDFSPVEEKKKAIENIKKINKFYLETGESKRLALSEDLIATIDEINTIKKELETNLALSIYDYKNLAEIFCNNIPPPSTITPTINEKASFNTASLRVQNPEKPSESFIKIQTIKKDTATIKTFTYRTGKQYRYLVSAGLVFNPLANKPKQVQTFVEKTDGKINVTHNVQPFNFFVSVNYYFSKKGLFVQEDKLWRKKGERRGGRSSVVFGLGISKRPMDNFFVGYSHDLVPGFKLNFLCKFFRNDDFLLRNDEIVYQKVVYRPSLCLGLSIDANSLSRALTNVLKIRNSK